MFFGCLSISACITSCAYLFLTNQQALLQITSPIPATFVIAIIAISISYLFLSIYSFSSDAIIQSYLLDEELLFAGGSNMPETMQEFTDHLQTGAKTSFTTW